MSPEPAKPEPRTTRYVPYLQPTSIPYHCVPCDYWATLADRPAHRATSEHKRIARDRDNSEEK